ncbi:hypothetical protein yc1106_06561 [Curvularia clavata]|uniref:Uncharacterized protein n=1 Tax=Curvularia clavata TaxID=95742 RepID=A0A9Q8ZA18_CURCL|nr:hypothetical protein yc1106_06561 [Curvularia clavata]
MSFRQALAPRSIHVRIVPRPANLSESREIYRVLQKFGEINTFKSLRVRTLLLSTCFAKEIHLTVFQYEYQNPAENSAFAIYRDERSAQRALDASPLRFSLEKVGPSTTNPNQFHSAEEEEGGAEGHDQLGAVTEQTSPDQGMDMMLRPSQLANPSLRPASTTKPTPQPTPMPFESSPASPKQTTQTKWFQVTLDRSRVVHQDYIERQPFWKQFSPMRSMAQEDLAKTVPHPGLSDISKRPPNAHRTPARVLRIMNDYVENIMPTPRGIADGDHDDHTFERTRER